MVRVPKYYRVKNEILALITDLAPGSAVETNRAICRTRVSVRAA